LSAAAAAQADKSCNWNWTNKPASGEKDQTMRRILCLYLPEWPLQRLLAEHRIQNSEFRIQKKAICSTDSAFCILHSAFPIILHARDPRRGDLVVACNSAARERGVRLGVPLAEASALASHASDSLEANVHIQPHDPGADLAALARLAERCERYSPLVGWKTVEGGEGSGFRVRGSGKRSEVGGREPACGPDSLFLDITGIGVLFGGEESLAHQALADLARLGYEARAGLADTIGAAWAAASMHNVHNVHNAVQYLTVVPPNTYAKNDPSRICPRYACIPPALPLAALRLPRETVDLLAELGVVHLEQLLTLPRESLRARFGERLILRLDQFLGTAQETIVAYRPPPRFAEEWIFDFPAEQREAIEQIVRELLRRVAGALAARREGAVQLTCRLDCAPGRPIFLAIGLFRPSADPEHLWDLMRMQLEQTALPGPVGRVTVEAWLTAPLENRQGELFANGEHEAARQLALFIDRATSRLGPQAVLWPKLTADPLPERAVRYVTGVRRKETGNRGQGPGGGKRRGNGKRGRERGSQETFVLSTEYSVPSTKPARRSHATSIFSHPASHSALERPLTLHSPPLALDVVSVVPDGPPVKFHLHAQVHHVARSWGPERIETGWWRGASVQRNYWRIETDSGQRFWLFRRLADGKWHLHGEF
jgi:protein ImuB